MRRMLIDASKRFPVVRILRHYYILLRSWISGIANSIEPIQKRSVIFQAYNGRYTCSPKAVYELMQDDETYNDFHFTWVVQDPARYKNLALQPRTTLVTFKSREYYRAFARSQIWVVNNMLPLRVRKRRGQTMVQCWHGTPLKRLRADIVEGTQNAMNSRDDFVRKNEVDTRRWDYLLSPSPFATEKFVSAFGIDRMRREGNIWEIGYPRNDALHTATPQTVRALKKTLGLPPDKKVVLYAPTWRDDQHDSASGYIHKNQLDLQKLKATIGKDYIVLYRAHYLITNEYDLSQLKGFVYDVSDIDDINDLYLVSDILVTDYSSAAFDFANTRKPMFFYMYDLDHYKDNLRGFYFDITELPGEISNTQERLVDCLQHLDRYTKTYQAAYQRFVQKFCPLDDGQAANRLRGLLFDPPPEKRAAHATNQSPITTRNM